MKNIKTSSKNNNSLIKNLFQIFEKIKIKKKQK